MVQELARKVMDSSEQGREVGPVGPEEQLGMARSSSSVDSARDGGGLGGQEERHLGLVSCLGQNEMEPCCDGKT